MISLGKTLLITGVFTLACTVANATNHKITAVNEKIIQQDDLLMFVVNVENNAKKSVEIATKKIAYTHKNFILPSISSKKVTYKSCQSKKKNELYELSAIFNDKLQMFLSYIDNAKDYAIAEKKDSTDDLNINTNVRIY